MARPHSMPFKVLFALSQLLLLSTAAAAADTPTGEYYWKNSYTRGVGTIPPEHSCANGKDEDAGLCYTPCKDNYEGIGPVCWQKNASYGRGVGTIPPCKGDKTSQNGLCYEPCKEGYNGKGPVCWAKGSLSYGRGVGTPLKSDCPSGKEADAGLCYTPCKDGFNGIGPVCWGKIPAGYIDCGAAFAKDKTTCATITAGQTISVGFLIVPNSAKLKSFIEARKVANLADKADEAVSVFQPLKDALAKMFETLKKEPTGAVKFGERLKNLWSGLSTAEKFKIKTTAKAIKTLIGLATAEDDSPIDIVRYVAMAASIVDPTGVASVAASFMYPVWGVEYAW